MLNTFAVATPADAQLADAFVSDARVARSLTGFGPGTVVRVRERICGVDPAGFAAGAGKAASGYLAGFAAWDRLGHVRGIAMIGSGNQNSTVQHDNSIQTTLLNPVTKGGVGPHPVREPGPA